MDYIFKDVLEICFGFCVLLTIFYLTGMDDDIKH